MKTIIITLFSLFLLVSCWIWNDIEQTIENQNNSSKIKTPVEDTKNENINKKTIESKEVILKKISDKDLKIIKQKEENMKKYGNTDGIIEPENSLTEENKLELKRLWNWLVDLVNTYKEKWDTAFKWLAWPRSYMYSFLVFCNNLIEVDDTNKDLFLSFLWYDTRKLYDYVVSNNITTPKDIAKVKDLINENDLDLEEFYLVLYINWNISKKELFQLYDSYILWLDPKEKHFNFNRLYMWAIESKINWKLNKNMCYDFVLNSNVDLDKVINK